MRDAEEPHACRPASARSRRRASCGSSARGRRRSSCAGRRCRARRRWPGRRSRSSTRGRGSAPCSAPGVGLRIRKRSSSNSVAVRLISSPPRLDLVAVLVQAQVADGQRPTSLGGLLRAGPAHQRAQPGDDLLQRERLGDVVVPAGGQAGDPVLDGVARGQEQDGYVVLVARATGGAPPCRRSRGASCPARRRPGAAACAVDDRLGAGERDLDLPALVAQRHPQQLGDVLLVVDDQHAQGAAVGAGEVGSARSSWAHSGACAADESMSSLCVSCERLAASWTRHRFVTSSCCTGHAQVPAHHGP